MRLLLVASAITIIGSAAAAQAQDKPAVAVSQPADPADKQVCKRISDAPTGSHFIQSKRVCHTAAEWRQIDQENRDMLERMRNEGTDGGQ